MQRDRLLGMAGFSKRFSFWPASQRLTVQAPPLAAITTSLSSGGHQPVIAAARADKTVIVIE